MGLDIIYLSGLTPYTGALDKHGDPEDESTIHLYENPDFPGRAEGVPDGHYKYESREHFRAGGYGWYNAWRNDLAKMAGYPEASGEIPGVFGGTRTHTGHDVGAWHSGGGPFFELIHFSDCEGTIGPAVSKKLADDFAKYQEAADSFIGTHDDGKPGGYFAKTYAEFRKAFEVASNNGAVDFC